VGPFLFEDLYECEVEFLDEYFFLSERFLGGGHGDDF